MPDVDPDMIAAIVAATMNAQKKEQQVEEEDEWFIPDETNDEISLGPEVSGESGLFASMLSYPDDEVNTKSIEGLKTGTLLDDMFLDNDGNSLGGIPKGSIMALTGLAGSGKSILMSEAILNIAQDKKVLYVISEDIFKSETDRLDMQSRLIDKTKILGLDWEKIKDNLIVMDAVQNKDLRIWKTFSETYRYAIEAHSIKFVVIDSVTMLEDKRNSLKFRIMEIARFNQRKGITTVLVNQRATENWDSYNMAGGHAIAHAVDGTILVDKGRTYHGDQVDELGKRGTEVRMVRIMDCRLSDTVPERIPVTVITGGFLRKIE